MRLLKHYITKLANNKIVFIELLTYTSINGINILRHNRKNSTRCNSIFNLQQILILLFDNFFVCNRKIVRRFPESNLFERHKSMNNFLLFIHNKLLLNNISISLKEKTRIKRKISSLMEAKSKVLEVSNR